MNASSRQRLLLAAAAGLALWSAWSVFKPADGAAPETTRRARSAATPSAAPGATRAEAKSPAQVLALRATVTVAASRNPFDANPWVVKREAPKVAAPVVVAAPPVAVQAPVPAPPPPPQLPYRFLGTYAEKTDSPTVFLALGERLLVAKTGDTLEGGFRLEAVSARELTFVHVQQNVTLRLSVTGGPI